MIQKCYEYTVKPFSCNGREIFCVGIYAIYAKNWYNCELELRLYHTVKLITQVKE